MFFYNEILLVYVKMKKYKVNLVKIFLRLNLIIIKDFKLRVENIFFLIFGIEIIFFL